MSHYSHSYLGVVVTSDFTVTGHCLSFERSVDLVERSKGGQY